MNQLSAVSRTSVSGSVPCGARTTTRSTSAITARSGFGQLVHLTAVRPGRDAHFVARFVAQDPPPGAVVDDDAAARSDCGLHPFARLVAPDRHVDVHSVVERLGRIEVLHPNR